jgi:hypothetical protein
MASKMFLPALVLALPLAAGAYEHDPHKTLCQAVRGTLVPECNGSACNTGRVTGDFAGRFNSRVTSMYPAQSGWLYSSWVRIELDGRKGTIEFQNEGTMPFDAKGGFEQAQATEVLVLADASGAYRDFTATLVMTGAHALGRPTPYTGRLCHPIPQG